MKKIYEVVGIVVVGLAMVALIASISAYPTKWMVNYLFSGSFLQGIFGVPHIGFWQAFWLDGLCGLLFKSSTSSSK